MAIAAHGLLVAEMLVYRASPADIEACERRELAAYLNRLDPLVKTHAPDMVEDFRRDWNSAQWRPYPYNQVVGFVQLHAENMGFKCAVFLRYTKRARHRRRRYEIVRNRMTRLCDRHAVHECYVAYGGYRFVGRNLPSNEELANGAIGAIRDVADHLHPRFVDSTAFVALARHVDWRGIIEQARNLSSTTTQKPGT